MRTLTEEDIKRVEFEIKEEARKEAIEILEKCPEPRYKEFIHYSELGQGNVCCLVLDAAKDDLVENNIMTQNKYDFFGYFFD